MDNFLTMELWSNTGQDYLVAAMVFFAALLGLKVFQLVILKKLHKIAQNTETDIDDLIISLFNALKWPFYVAASFYFALQRLVIAPLLDRIIDGVIVLVLIVYVVFVVQEILNYGTKKILSKEKDGEKADPTAIKTINSLLKLVVWVFAVIMILSNWGVNVTSLVAGLGIGGIALAFAFQNILEDVFSSFSILIDKPFKVGDFITVGSDSGTVVKVGIKTTRIRTSQGEEMVISNRELTSARVQNFGKLERRRNLFVVGATYETPEDKLKKIPDIIKNVVDEIEGATFGRVHFKDFGASSLDFEVVYYAETSEYDKYMDLQQEVKFGIFDALTKEGIEFAYPTQTHFVKK